jgi:hypothetical protein
MKKIIKFWIYILILGTFNLACANDDDGSQPKEKEYTVNFNQTNISLKEGKGRLLTAEFSEDAAKLDYNLHNSNPDVIKLENQGKESVSIHALSVGEAIVTIESTSKEVSAQCKISVTQRGVVKLLGLGNSFLQNAVEQNLYELAKAEGIDIIIGSMTIGGCSLDTHWNNISNDKAAYSYLKIEGENRTRTPNKAVSSIIKEEDWDYISIQQVSGYSGISTSYSNLSGILSYLRENATNPDVEFILHQTWAYAENSTHTDFPKYDKDQMKMYRAIIETTKQAAQSEGMDIIIPAGTAIQNARTSYIGDNFTKDGYHLNSIGMYTAACTWFEKLFGIDVRNNSFRPASVSNSEVSVARAAAHFAAEEPYKVTELTEFKDNQEIKELTKPVYVNFGNKTSVSSWNNLTEKTAGSSIDLIDEDGTELGIKLIIKKNFSGINGNGPTVTQIPEFSMPEEVSKSSLFGNSIEFSGQTNPEAEIEITGLNPDKKYDFLFFGSRTATDNRETKYTVTGTNEEIVYLNTSSNTTLVASTEQIKPLSNGTISINVTYGPNNNNQYRFYHINAMKLSPTE